MKSVEALLGALRTAPAAAWQPSSAAGEAAAGGVDFAGLLKAQIDNVNRVQQSAEDKVTRFQMEDPNVDLTDTMVSLAKANLSFQQAVQVRNKLVSAYHDIMNMQV